MKVFYPVFPPDRNAEEVVAMAAALTMKPSTTARWADRGRRVVELDVPTMREYFERGGRARDGPACRRSPRCGCGAPIIAEEVHSHGRELPRARGGVEGVGWSHEIAPWIVFFQNVDAIIGPDDPVVYPEHLTEELDYELELAVVIRKAGKWFPPEEAMDYVGGYVIFNDITARDIQRREMRVGRVLVLQGDRHVLPARAVDRDARRDPRPARPGDGAARERRVAADLALGPMSVTIPEILSHYSPLGLLGGRRRLDGNRVGRGRVLAGRRVALPQARRRDGGRDRAHRRPPQPGRLVAGCPRRAPAATRPLVTAWSPSLSLCPHPGWGSSTRLPRRRRISVAAAGAAQPVARS